MFWIFQKSGIDRDEMKDSKIKEREYKEKVLRKAFWSGTMAYRKWRRIIRGEVEAHNGVFCQSFRHLPMRFLLQEVGKDHFVRIWPELHNSLSEDSPEDKRARDAWDALWGMMTVGDSQYPVSSAVSNLSKKRREVMRLIVGNPGTSAYGIAKITGRDYSRVHKDISMLMDMGIVNAIEGKDLIRKRRQLIPVHSVNAVLAGF